MGATPESRLVKMKVRERQSATGKLQPTLRLRRRHRRRFSLRNRSSILYARLRKQERQHFLRLLGLTTMNLLLAEDYLLQDYPEHITNTIRSGHSTCVRFNRTGDFLASGRVDGTVVIWDLETMGVARKLRGHSKNITSLSWSRCGRYLLSACQGWKAILWDLQDGTKYREVRFRAPVYGAELHPMHQYVGLSPSPYFQIAVAGADLIITTATSSPPRYSKNSRCSSTLPIPSKYDISSLRSRNDATKVSTHRQRNSMLRKMRGT